VAPPASIGTTTTVHGAPSGMDCAAIPLGLLLQDDPRVQVDVGRGDRLLQPEGHDLGAVHDLLAVAGDQGLRRGGDLAEASGLRGGRRQRQQDAREHEDADERHDRGDDQGDEESCPDAHGMPPSPGSRCVRTARILP
jgi:hypothetical protein